ncbi:MAG: MtrAB system histidine kinase MtrB [Microbacteriaceae bacterium]
MNKLRSIGRRVGEPIVASRDRVRDVWRHSMKVRTMTITGVMTGLMIFISGTFILASVSNDLFTQQRDEILHDSARATVLAQQTIDSAGSSDPRALGSVVNAMRRSVSNMSASDYLVFRRQSDQPRSVDAPLDSTIGPEFSEFISDDLRNSLLEGDAPQYWQSIEIVKPDGSTVPGLAVGSTLQLPGEAGRYDLILGYDLSETDSIYGFISRTLVFTGFFLMLLIGALVYGITRLVFQPIRSAADTSRKLAKGDSNARMPLQNDEYFDQLAGNFNLMADTLQTRITELDDLSTMQQRFVSDVSHELRTPLTTMKLASQVLASNSDGLSGGQSRAIEVMSEQVDRFEALLADLLEISRYDAGQVAISTEPTNLVRLTEEVIEGLAPLSKQPIELHALGGYAPIEVDPRRIRRIVSNLVGNAIEHGEDKPIEVRVDSNGSATAISVRDWGIGMNEEATERVFERFWRADPSRKRTLGGTGLGLAIAREDATVHGGVLEVWSKPGQGTNFRLTLPRDEGGAGFFSPLPLIPEDMPEASETFDTTGGWLKRPLRRLKKGDKR